MENTDNTNSKPISSGEETYDDIIVRHKKEQRDLLAKITGMKKQASKKTRRNVNVQCQELQSDLDNKHQQELKNWNKTEDGGNEDGQEGDSEELTPDQLLAQISISEPTTKEPTDSSPVSKDTKSKRNRQKEKLAKRNAEINRLREEALEETKDSVDYRKIELETMDKLLQMNNLKLFEIIPDGNCLFSSMIDQLKLRHNKTFKIEDLRQQAAVYIKDNKDDFTPFLIEKDTLLDINEYCEKLTTTTMWGSDIEILAFSQLFDCPIEIFLAGSENITFNESGNNTKLILGFYKHSYGLGEHYNSLRDN